MSCTSLAEAQISDVSYSISLELRGPNGSEHAAEYNGEIEATFSFVDKEVSPQTSFHLSFREKCFWILLARGFTVYS